MATASDIINDALEEIGYKSAEAPVEAADAQLGLRKLNDMLAEWNDPGIKLGAAPVAALADTVRLPRGAVGAVKLNLAGRLAGPFSRPISVELAASIKASTDALLRAIVKPIEVEYPGTLPLGAGNECNDVNWDARFFTQNDKENF